MSRKIKIGPSQRGINLAGQVLKTDDVIVVSDTDWAALSASTLVGSVIIDQGSTTEQPTNGDTDLSGIEAEIAALQSGKQDVASAATDSELAAAVTTLNATVAAKAPVSAAWQASTAYKAGQVVTYNSLLWQANADFTSGATFNASNWTLLSGTKVAARPM